MKMVLFEGTPVVFTPLGSKGKYPGLVVVDLRDLIEASNRHRKELLQAQQEERRKAIEEIIKELDTHEYCDTGDKDCVCEKLKKFLQALNSKSGGKNA